MDRNGSCFFGKRKYGSEKTKKANPKVDKILQSLDGFGSEIVRDFCHGRPFSWTIYVVTHYMNARI